MGSLFEWLRGRRNHSLYDAMHDRTTGLYNQSGFQMFYRDADMEHSALILLELMNTQNKPHKMIESSMKTLAGLVNREFRSVDQICRVRDNQIAIIMARMNSMLIDTLVEKVKHIFKDCKPDTLQVGIAFGDRDNPTEDMLEDTVSALNQAKKSGQSNAIRIYGVEHHSET